MYTGCANRRRHRSAIVTLQSNSVGRNTQRTNERTNEWEKEATLQQKCGSSRQYSETARQLTRLVQERLSHASSGGDMRQMPCAWAGSTAHEKRNTEERLLGIVLLALVSQGRTSLVGGDLVDEYCSFTIVRSCWTWLEHGDECDWGSQRFDIWELMSDKARIATGKVGSNRWCWESSVEPNQA